MATHPFRIVNVFTENQGTLTGNPLCVFEDAQALDSETMQGLARQFNLSETTFILPSTRAAARVRIFTPNYEMPFAGHPTLGTAHVCRALKLGGDTLELEMQAGVIPVRASANRWTLTAPSPAWRELETAPRSCLAAALGLEPSDIGERPMWVTTGSEQLVVPLTSTDAVRRVSPDPQLLNEIRSRDGRNMAYVFAVEGGQALARFFFPQGTAILEDPATGSATANFGGWWLAMQRALPLDLRISQGEFAGRPSHLYLRVSDERRIDVGGDVLEIGRGSISL